MISYSILTILYILLFYFEASALPFPFVFIYSLLLLIYYRFSYFIILAFVGGLALDVLRMNTVGITPLFIFSTLFLIDLYRFAFNTKDKKFILVLLFFISLAYTYVVSYYVYILYFGICFILLGILLYTLSKTRRAMAS